MTTAEMTLQNRKLITGLRLAIDTINTKLELLNFEQNILKNRPEFGWSEEEEKEIQVVRGRIKNGETMEGLRQEKFPVDPNTVHASRGYGQRRGDTK